MLLFVAIVIALLLPAPLIAQNDKAPSPVNSGYLDIRHGTVEWPDPEILVSQLRSPTEHARLNALRLIGLADNEAYHSVWGQNSPSTRIGKKLVAPDEVRLMYAALGEDLTQQAVIAVLDVKGQKTYAAVGMPTAKGWKRLAVFECWCKYEMSHGQDTLAGFVQVQPVPQSSPANGQRFELVLHASGGGTGIYTQNEVHFRLRNNQIQEVLSFVSRFRTGCTSKPSCVHLEARWFHPRLVENTPGGVLVTAVGDFNPTTAQKVDWDIQALQDRHLQHTMCEPYIWKEAAFRYEAYSKGTVCP